MQKETENCPEARSLLLSFSLTLFSLSPDYTNTSCTVWGNCWGCTGKYVRVPLRSVWCFDTQQENSIFTFKLSSKGSRQNRQGFVLRLERIALMGSRERWYVLKFMCGHVCGSKHGRLMQADVYLMYVSVCDACLATGLAKWSSLFSLFHESFPGKQISSETH